MARPGEFLYDVSLTQKNTPFYDRSFVSQPNDGTARLSLSFVYGLTGDISLPGALNSVVTTDGERVGPAVAGGAERVGDLLGAVNLTTDTKGGIGSTSISWNGNYEATASPTEVVAAAGG